MSKAIDNLHSAQQRAMAGRPKVGGFPYLAETLDGRAWHAIYGTCPLVRVCM